MELSARLTVGLLDNEDGDVRFELGSVNSDLDAIEIFDYVKNSCYESLGLLMQAEKCVYFLLDELVLLFDSELYSSEDTLSILANAVNAFLSQKLQN